MRSENEEQVKRIGTVVLIVCVVIILIGLLWLWSDSCRYASTSGFDTQKALADQRKVLDDDDIALRSARTDPSPSVSSIAPALSSPPPTGQSDPEITQLFRTIENQQQYLTEYQKQQEEKRSHPPSFEIVQWSFVKQDFGGGDTYYKVIGELKSRNNRRYDTVMMDVVLYDGTGRIIATGGAYCNNLSPNGISIIQGYVLDSTNTKSPIGRIQVSAWCPD